MSRFEQLRRKCQRMASCGKPCSDRKLVAKNTLVLYVRMLVVMFVGFFTSRIQLEALGVKDFGLFNVAAGVVGFIVFLNGSLSAASSRYLTVELGKGTIGSLKKVFSTIVNVHLTLSALFLALLETIGVYILKTKLNIDPARASAVMWCYQCSVITTCLTITQLPYTAAIIAHERMSAFAWMTLYDVFAKLAVVYMLLECPFDHLKVYAVLLAVVASVNMLIYRAYCVYSFRECRYRLILDRNLMMPIFSFAGWHVATQLVLMLLTQGVIMVNQRYFGPVLVSAVAIAQSVNAQVQGFVNNFKTAANPQIIKLHAAGNLSEVRELLRETTLFSVYLLLAMGVPIWFYSSEALHIWLGSNVPTYSPIMVKIMLVAAFFSVFDVSFYVILYAEGRIKENMWLNLVCGLGAFGLILYLVLTTHNPLTSVLVLGGFQIVLGMINKPLLLHFLSGYSFRFFAGIFLNTFKALIICMASGAVVKHFMPAGTWWCIFECGIIAVLNVGLIALFAADKKMRTDAKQALMRKLGR